MSPNNILILFNKVDAQPATSPPSAIWHFGWHVTNVRANIKAYEARPEVRLLPLYTTDEGGFVLINSDTWPAPKGSAPGLTKAQIAEAKANGVRPLGGGGFAYMQGPDGAWWNTSATIQRNALITCIFGRKTSTPPSNGTSSTSTHPLRPGSPAVAWSARAIG